MKKTVYLVKCVDRYYQPNVEYSREVALRHGFFSSTLMRHTTPQNFRGGWFNTPLEASKFLDICNLREDGGVVISEEVDDGE